MQSSPWEIHSSSRSFSIRSRCTNFVYVDVEEELGLLERLLPNVQLGRLDLAGATGLKVFMRHTRHKKLRQSGSPGAHPALAARLLAGRRTHAAHARHTLPNATTRGSNGELSQSTQLVHSWSASYPQHRPNATSTEAASSLGEWSVPATLMSGELLT